MRKSTLLLAAGLWLLLLTNLCLLMHLDAARAREVQQRIQTRQSSRHPVAWSALVIINAPPDFYPSSSGPPGPRAQIKSSSAGARKL